MTITPTSVDQIDLTDVDLFLHGDPDAVWTTLRREAPVHWNERSWGPGFWNITRYEDVMRVSTDAYNVHLRQGDHPRQRWTSHRARAGDVEPGRTAWTRAET